MSKVIEINQAWELVNAAASEALGRESVLEENLSNLVDTGDEIANANAVDVYTKSLMLRVGRTVFVDRVYAGSVPSVQRSAVEFGAIVEKIQMDTPEAQENETWSLQDGQTYNQDVFSGPKISAKFFVKKSTFEVQMSIAERQVKGSFTNAQQLAAFISMIYTTIEKAMTIRIDELTMRAINNFTAETVYDDFGANSISSTSGVKAVNLLYLYNTKYNTSLTAADALTTPTFIRFASYTMKNYMRRLARVSSLFNIGGKDRFTPSDMLHVVMLSDFETAAETYLYDGEGQFRVDGIRLPAAETVPYWQGSGTDYAFSSTGKIDVVTADNHDVTVTGVLAVMFDEDALGVTNYDRRVTNHYNAKAEFINNYYKFDAGYFNDGNENFVVFFAA